MNELPAQDDPGSTTSVGGQDRVAASPAAKPKPTMPSPAHLAGRRARVRPVAPSAQTGGVSQSAKFGRVDSDGTVWVRTEPEGERAVGSYPGSTPEEALRYFARKYDDIYAAADLLAQRLTLTEVSAQEAREALQKLRHHIGEANVVGDLALLDKRVAAIETSIQQRSEVESQRRAEAKVAAGAAREKVVRAAEKIAQRDPSKMQWKQASSRMRELFDEWKAQQHHNPRLDKPVEDGLWQRFTQARSAFETSRREFFVHLDQEQDDARRQKERLVLEAETLSTSKDWGATAGEFKRLMEQWRHAGRAQRSVDDDLWGRFKTAQEQFFSAKDEVVAAERVQFEANLAVKEKLLTEAESLVPVTDMAVAKRTLRSIQDRWDEAGKVPRSDMQRIEGRLKKVEQAFRDGDERRWQNTNPEMSARAQSMVEQLEKAVATLTADLATATEHGDTRAIVAAEQALSARQEWLASARAGLADLGR